MGVGSGVGGMLGTAAGTYFGPAGMAVGSAAGSAVGGLFDMFKQKTSDEIKQSSSSAIADLNAQRNLREANAQEGMSTGQYQRQQDASNRDLLANNRTLNALTDNTGMGSLAREQMSKGLIKSFINAQQKLRDRQLENDIRQEQQNLTNKMKATEQVMRTGQIEDARQAKILAREDQRKALFAKSIQGAMKAAAAGAAYGDKNGWGQFTKDRAKAAQANLDETVAKSSGIAGALGGVDISGSGVPDLSGVKPITGDIGQATGGGPSPIPGIDSGPISPDRMSDQLPQKLSPSEVLSGKTVTPEQVASNPEAVAKVAETDPDAAAKMISSSTIAQIAQTYGSFNGMPESFGLGPDLGFGMSLDTPDLDPELNQGLNLTLGEGYMYSGANNTGNKVQPIPPETAPTTPDPEAAPALPEDPKEIKSADPTISAGDAEVKAVGNSLYNDIAGTSDELDNRGKPKPNDQKEEAPTEETPQKEDTSIKDAIEVERKKLRDSETDTDSNTDVADIAKNIVLRDVAEGKDAPKNLRVNGYDYNQSASDGTKYYKYFRDKGVDLQRIHDDDYLLYLQEEGIIGEGDLEKLDDWFLASEEAKQKGDR